MQMIFPLIVVAFSGVSEVLADVCSTYESNLVTDYGRKLDGFGIIKCLEPTDPKYKIGVELGKEVMEESTHVGFMYGPIRGVYGQYGREGDSDFLHYYVLFHWPAGKDSSGQPRGNMECMVHFSNNKSNNRKNFKKLLDGPACQTSQKEILRDLLDWFKNPSKRTP